MNTARKLLGISIIFLLVVASVLLVYDIDIHTTDPYAPAPGPAPTTTTTSIPVHSATTIPAPVAQPVPLPTVTTTTTQPPVVSVSTSTPAPAPAPAPAAQPAGFGCQYALPYLYAHQAPGFTDICTDDPNATIMGNEAATCIPPNAACTAGPEIAIADPCPAAYMNEASNSWVLEGLSTAPIDPYGSCPPD